LSSSSNLIPSRDLKLNDYLNRHFKPSSSSPRPRARVMESLCIICLNPLPSVVGSNNGGSLHGASEQSAVVDESNKITEPSPPSRGDVAHLQNCRHKFHDHCIAVWIEVFFHSYYETDYRWRIHVLHVVQTLIKSTSQIRSKVHPPSTSF